jgi:hypothetical protein
VSDPIQVLLDAVYDRQPKSDNGRMVVSTDLLLAAYRYHNQLKVTLEKISQLHSAHPLSDVQLMAKHALIPQEEKTDAT